MKKISKKVLREHLKKKHFVTVSSVIAKDEENYRGYLIKVSNDYICMMVIKDWHTDGYVILPMKFVSDIKYSKYEKKNNEILIKEGVISEIPKLSWLSLKSSKSIFISLEKKINTIIVESRLPKVDEFVVGKIKKVKNKHVYLKGFDGTGKWLDGIFKIPYSEITSVTFGDEYSTVFEKYTWGD